MSAVRKPAPPTGADSPGAGWTVHLVAYLAREYFVDSFVQRLAEGFGLRSLLVVPGSASPALSRVPAGACVTVLMATSRIEDRDSADAWAAAIHAAVEPDVVEARVEVLQTEVG